MRARLGCLLVLLLAPTAAWAIRFPTPPPPGTFVVDEAGLLKPAQVAEVTNTASALMASERLPLYVVTVSSLASCEASGETIESFATKLFDTWGIGSQQRNGGLLLLVSVGDRKARHRAGRRVRPRPRRGGARRDEHAHRPGLQAGRLRHRHSRRGPRHGRDGEGPAPAAPDAARLVLAGDGPRGRGRGRAGGQPLPLWPLRLGLGRHRGSGRARCCSRSCDGSEAATGSAEAPPEAAAPRAPGSGSSPEARSRVAFRDTGQISPHYFAPRPLGELPRPTGLRRVASLAPERAAPSAPLPGAVRWSWTGWSASR